MGKLLIFVLACAAVAVLYGEYDAARVVTFEDPGFKARTVDAFFVNGDMLEAHPGRPRGQMYVSLSWQPLPNDARVSRIHLKGKVTEPGQPDVHFDQDCERGSADLSTTIENPDLVSYGSSNLVCFIMVDKVVPIALDPTTNQNSMTDIAAMGERVRNMRVVYTAQAYGKRPPLAYVSWVNDKVAALTARKWQ